MNMIHIFIIFYIGQIIFNSLPETNAPFRR